MKKWDRKMKKKGKGADEIGRQSGNLNGNGEMHFANMWCMGM